MNYNSMKALKKHLKVFLIAYNKFEGIFILNLNELNKINFFFFETIKKNKINYKFKREFKFGEYLFISFVD